MSALDNPWRFVLTDLEGSVLGELTNASDRQVVLPHLRMPGLSCKLPLRHSLADAVLNTDTMVKGYRGLNLAFHGPTISAEEVADEAGQSVQLNAAGVMWRYNKKVITDSLADDGVKVVPVNYNVRTWISTTLTEINANSRAGAGTNEGGMAIADPPGGSPTWPSIEAGPWHSKMFAEAVAELCNMAGVEFRVNPIEPIPPGGGLLWPTIGKLEIAANPGILGTDHGDNVVFEYGTSVANIKSYTRSVDRSSIANLVYVPRPDFPEPGRAGAAYAEWAGDTTSITARGRFDDVVDPAGITLAADRLALVNLHLALRKNPRERITFTPVRNAEPEPIVDYNVGDTIRVRAFLGAVPRFDVDMRIWGMTFSIDDAGNESVELEVVEP